MHGREAPGARVDVGSGSLLSGAVGDLTREVGAGAWAGGGHTRVGGPGLFGVGGLASAGCNGGCGSFDRVGAGRETAAEITL